MALGRGKQVAALAACHDSLGESLGIGFELAIKDGDHQIFLAGEVVTQLALAVPDAASGSSTLVAWTLCSRSRRGEIYGDPTRPDRTGC